jgi:hypothetical protein
MKYLKYKSRNKFINFDNQIQKIEWNHVKSKIRLFDLTIICKISIFRHSGFQSPTKLPNRYQLQYFHKILLEL